MSRAKVLMSCLVVLGLSVAVWGQDEKKQGYTGQKAWFDLEHCAMCKNIGEQKGLMDAMKWETHKIDNGMLMLAAIPEEFKTAWTKAEEGMKKAEAELASGKTGIEMCGFCEAFGEVMAAGAKVKEIESDIGEVSLITSDDPKIVEKLHAIADRCNDEAKKMKEEKGAAKSPETNATKK